MFAVVNEFIALIANNSPNKNRFFFSNVEHKMADIATNHRQKSKKKPLLSSSISLLKAFHLQPCQMPYYKDIDSIVQNEKCRMDLIRAALIASRSTLNAYKHKGTPTTNNQLHNVKCSLNRHHCEWLHKNKWNCTILWTNKSNWTKLNALFLWWWWWW